MGHVNKPLRADSKTTAAATIRAEGRPFNRSLEEPPGGEVELKTILLIHPSTLVRQALAIALRHLAGLEVATAGHVTGAVDQATALQPQVALLDVNSGAPAITTAVRMIVGASPGTRVVVTGLRDCDADIMAVIEAGAVGYVVRDTPLEDLVGAVKAALDDDFVAPPRVVTSAFRRLAQLRKAVVPEALPGAIRLTRREREILALICHNLCNKEIAVRLHIETPTVKNHVHNVLTKLGMHSRHEVARHPDVADLL
jgi:two-component system, NarL family, nitrate/nitrite response regulator NarL